MADRRREGAEGLATASKTAAEAKYANQVESSLNALLLRTVGDGKAQVKVTADLDVDKVTEKQLRYEREGTPVEEVEETEQLEGGGGAGGTGAGTRANIPTYTAATRRRRGRRVRTTASAPTHDQRSARRSSTASARPAP